MPLDLQTLEEKKQQIQADVESATEQTLKKRGVWFTTIFATVLAGLSHVFDLLVVKALKNVFLSTCKDVGLLTRNWAVWTRTPRKTKTAAILNVSGSGTPLATIQGGINGKQFVYSTGVKFYLVENLSIPSSGIIDTNVRAFLPGIDGNIQSGELNVTQTTPDLTDGKLTIVEIATPGTDDEEIETWSAAMQRVLRQPVLADNYSYYHNECRKVEWCVAGYAYVDEPGTLEIYAESSNLSALGVPTDDEISYMYDFLTGEADEDGDGNPDGNVRVPLDLMELKPDGITPRLAVYKSEPTEFYVIVTGVTDPEQQESITTEVKKYFPTRKPYIKGVSVYDAGTLSQGDLRSKVQGGIDKVGGGTYGDVALYLSADDSSVGTYGLGRGERANLPTVDGVRFQ